MIEYLGIDGMSSDESEAEDLDLRPATCHPPRYLIHPPQWRARDVEPWLRMFDSVHNILRRCRVEDHDTRGAFPRIRTPTNRKSASLTFVPGLPTNAYDAEWMNRDILRKYDLHPLPQNYDFTHDADVILYVIELPYSIDKLLISSQVGSSYATSVDILYNLIYICICVFSVC